MSDEITYVIGPSDEPNWPTGDENIHIDADGERVYPCRCGKTHRGDYAAYDWGHHNCFHNSRLQRIAPGEIDNYLMCPECGKTFWIEEEPSA